MARFREDRNEHMVVEEKPEGMIMFRRPRCRWEDCTKIGLRGISWIYSILIRAIGRLT